NHRTPEGRKVLLEAKYKLAWGDPRVKAIPDSFLTGLVSVSKDLKTLRISFLYFDSKSKKLEDIQSVPDVVVANRPASLVEMGESFTVRGAFDDGKVEAGTKEKAKNDPPKDDKKNEPPADLPKDKDQSALQQAADVRDRKTAKHPAEDPDAPIR